MSVILYEPMRLTKPLRVYKYSSTPFTVSKFKLVGAVNSLHIKPSSNLLISLSPLDE